MELNGLEADATLVKTQMTVTKKEQNTETSNKNQMTKPKNKLQKQYQTKHSKTTNVVIAKRQAT